MANEASNFCQKFEYKNLIPEDKFPITPMIDGTPIVIDNMNKRVFKGTAALDFLLEYVPGGLYHSIEDFIEKNDIKLKGSMAKSQEQLQQLQKQTPSATAAVTGASTETATEVASFDSEQPFTTPPIIDEIPSNLSVPIVENLISNVGNMSNSGITGGFEDQTDLNQAIVM